MASGGRDSPTNDVIEVVTATGVWGSTLQDIMIKQCSHAGNQYLSPFIKGGNFLQVAQVAIKKMGKAVTCAVTYEVWLNLRMKAALLIASQDIQAEDAHGDWLVMEIQLNTFDKVLHKIKNYPSNQAFCGDSMRNLEWVEWDQKAGWFIMMVTGFIICLFGEKSPIALQIQRCEKVNAWWEKHSVFGVHDCGGDSDIKDE
ncbi:hypothetical protein EDD16DRAFT_1524317 [Pisolithus croceorrhizus]|nr:hypothetical protein EDD16DRAFT_1524317 [Pisolithus croceorrhizus]